MYNLPMQLRLALSLSLSHSLLFSSQCLTDDDVGSDDDENDDDDATIISALVCLRWMRCPRSHEGRDGDDGYVAMG